jgi:hypothetical protein
VRLRLSLVVALLVLALLSSLSALRPQSASGTHGCAPPIPPPVPGPLVPAPATPGIVRINEVLNAPATIWNCLDQGNPSNRTDSWIELYNPTNQALNLSASHAAINSNISPYPFGFPPGAAIAAKGFLVLFPDAHANLLVSGANLTFTINSVTIDQLTIPTLAPDQSYARVPDGANTWLTTLSPTIDASNNNTAPERIPTPTFSSNGGTGAGSYGSGTGHTSSTPTLVNGTQPTWNKLQLPTSVPVSTVTASMPFTVSSPLPATNSISDIPHRILLTILLVALAFTLFWCWRLFRPS